MDVADYIRRQNERVEATKVSPADALDKYKNYSEEQLMSELFRLGSLSTGRISAQELDDFFAKVSPYLTPEQRAKMKDLIIQLKNS